jgi:hypothetical protein
MLAPGEKGGLMGALLDTLKAASRDTARRSAGNERNERNEQSLASGTVDRAAADLSSLNSFISFPERLTAGDWRDWYQKRAAIRQYDGNYTRAEAERLAWGEVVNEWHRRQGERAPRDLCAGCLKPIGDSGEVFDHADGTQTHMADGFDCVVKYGDRWRGAAEKALVAMGLTPPSVEGGQK